MTEKQLDEGRMLLDKIKRLRSEREKWEKMIGFDRVEIKIANPLRGCKYDAVVVNPLFWTLRRSEHSPLLRSMNH